MIIVLCVLFYLLIGLLTAACVQVVEPATCKEEEIGWATFFVFVWPIVISYVLCSFVLLAPYRFFVWVWHKILEK